MKIAVTGASGFIGRHVVRTLAARGDQVTAIVRPRSPSLATLTAPPGGMLCQASLTPGDLETAFSGADAVVHLAGVISSSRRGDYAAVNAEGTRAAAEAARAAGARFVYVSSLAAAGPAPAAAPRDERDPPAPINSYGLTKLAGERAVEAVGGLQWTILRPGVVYGDGDHALTPLFAMTRLPIMPVVGGAGTAYTFVHIDDMVRAVVAAIDRAAAGLTCFVGHPAPVGARALVRAVRAAARSRALLVPVPSPLVWIAANVCELAGTLAGRELLLSRRRYAEMYAEGFVCRVERLKEELGVAAAVGIDAGLERSAAWYLRDATGRSDVRRQTFTSL
ncbi:MAG TPA: NAD(P)-dependent oxidoreductase [Vicinamibacterales bacterium]|nr:NAD(P)-dependent oxidoreductase [Vicinamibacterales bacterium]